MQYTVKEIEDKIKESVKGQDEYVNALANAIWLHMLRREAKENGGDGLNYAKPNMLVIGNSGTGKTLAAKTAARIGGFDIVIEDASEFTRNGWHGRDVASIIGDVRNAADGDMDRAKCCIVVLDEFDKAMKSERGMDVTSPSDNFLKFIEGGKATYVKDHGNSESMDTGDLLFICMGAFEGLDKIIRKRIEGNQIGFGSSREVLSKEEVLHQVTVDDLIEYGLNPQLLGRLPIITVTDDLTEPVYEDILINSRSSPVEGYNNIFLESLGVGIGISPKAADVVAGKAMASATGARSLNAMIAEIMEPAVTKISNDPNVRMVTIGSDGKGNIKLFYQYGPKAPDIPKMHTEAVKEPEISDRNAKSAQNMHVPLYMEDYDVGAREINTADKMYREVSTYKDADIGKNRPYRCIKAAEQLIAAGILDAEHKQENAKKHGMIPFTDLIICTDDIFGWLESLKGKDIELVMEESLPNLTDAEYLALNGMQYSLGLDDLKRTVYGILNAYIEKRALHEEEWF